MSRLRVLLPVALAFSVAAGGLFAIGRLVRIEDGSLRSAVTVGGGSGAIEDIAWSSTVVTPDARQAQVLDRQVGLSAVLASILAVTSLLTALAYELLRGGTRRDELAVHRAVGASLRVLSRAAVLEGALVTLVGVTAGWALGSAVGEIALSTWPGGVEPRADAALMLVPVAVLAAAFFALSYGSWRSTTLGAVTSGAVFRPPPPDPYSGIAIIQIAGSVALLIASAVLLNAGAGDRGGRASLDAESSEEGLVVRIRGTTSLDTVRLLAGLQVVQGVSSVWVTSGGATVGLGTTDIALTECGRCWIGTSPVNVKGEDAVHHTVTWVGARAPFAIMAGRSFDPTDGPEDELVAVVSESFAQRNFEGGDAIGRRVRPGMGLDGWHRVIGISSIGLERTGFGSTAQPGEEVYLSAVQHPTRSVDVWVGGAPEEAAVLGAVRGLAGTSDVTLRSSRSHREASNAAAHWLGRLSVALGAVALLCSLLGVRAVTRLSLRVRRTEFGIHRAVGANRLRLARLALGQPFRASLIGTVLGLYGSMFFLDVLSDAMGAPTPTVGALAAIALLHVLAVLVGAAPITIRFAWSSPHELISGVR